MAKKKIDPAKVRARRRRRRQSESNAFFPLFVMALAGLWFASKELAMLGGIGLVPTLVLGLMGKGANKGSRLTCVFFANTAGTLYYFKMVLDQPSSIDTILANPMNILLMWGAAAVGHALIYIGPWIAAYFIGLSAQDKLNSLNKQRKALIDLWGQEVVPEREKRAPSTTKSRFL